MDLNETAFIAIDVQNDFCAPGGVMNRNGRNLDNIEQTVPQLLKSIEYCHDNNIQVILVKTSHSNATDSKIWKTRGKYSETNCSTEWGRELYKIQPRENDIVLEKNRYSGFMATNLDLILRSNGIKNILMSGFTTNVCVEGSARDGFMLGYNVITLSDCSACYVEQEHENALHNLRNYFGQVMSFEEIMNENKIIL